MQAAVSTTSFGFGGLKSAIVAGVFAAGVAIGVAGPLVIDHAPARHASVPAASSPRAYVNLNLGEGRVGPLVHAASTQLKAYASLGQGDGLVGNRASMSATLIAHTSVGMGEGWLSHGRPVVVLPLAHLSDGAGEGWLENGKP